MTFPEKFLEEQKIENFMTKLEHEFLFTRYQDANSHRVEILKFNFKIYVQILGNTTIDNSYIKLYYYVYLISVLGNNEQIDKIEQIKKLLNFSQQSFTDNLNDLSNYFIINNLDFSFLLKLTFNLNNLEKEKQFIFYILLYSENETDDNLKKIQPYLNCNEINEKMIEKGLELIFILIEECKEQKTTDLYISKFKCFFPI